MFNTTLTEHARTRFSHQDWVSFPLQLEQKRNQSVITTKHLRIHTGAAESYISAKFELTELLSHHHTGSGLERSGFSSESFVQTQLPPAFSTSDVNPIITLVSNERPTHPHFVAVNRSPRRLLICYQMYQQAGKQPSHAATV